MSETKDVELGNVESFSNERNNYILFFVNSKSGGQKGKIVFSGLQKLTKNGGPASGSVHDLAMVSKGEEHLPQNIIRRFLIDHPKLRVLVCGGDGTMCWVLNAIASLNLSKDAIPKMACMPLGTGNDLSRMYGWGTSFQRSQLRWSHIKKIHCARSVQFDLWALRVIIPSEAMTDQVKKWLPPVLHLQEEDGTTGEDLEIRIDDSGATSKVYTGHICNYVSIGMTARGAMAFHQERQNHPESFTGPNKNKYIYAKKGCGMFCSDCCCHPEIRQRVVLHVENDTTTSNSASTTSIRNEGSKGQDDSYKTVEIPSGLAEVNILNIQSYSGGVIKTPTQFNCPPSAGDGYLEVGGLTNYIPTSFKVGLCCCCSVSPIRPLAQSSAVRLTIVGDDLPPVAAQFDGEPFYLPTGAVVEIRKEKNPVFMLSLKKTKT
jgi:hypothetical protein